MPDRSSSHPSAWRPSPRQGSPPAPTPARHAPAPGPATRYAGPEPGRGGLLVALAHLGAGPGQRLGLERLPFGRGQALEIGVHGFPPGGLGLEPLGSA
jgi:hypothetical protein